MPLKKYVYLAAIAILAAPVTFQMSHAASTGTGNAETGKRLYNQCKACHSLTETDRPRLGPDLNNIFGRQAGAKSGFTYSKALQDADFKWTEEHLNEWLTKPNAFLPGNKMPYAGMRSEQNRKDLIAYLRMATVSKDEEE
ncbi:c-type cytochrome [Kordiimonas pumila]|uniref:C-type cytochrome n=1 Tax=Kordiimonas pumila TaxID=2161677 RepID=A0ABV7D376_9PROT|nr:cytochrome c family protein [Kordiimonas pumila]